MMTVDDAVVGSRLQAARRALGLTQGDVGKQMDMAISTISTIEAGKRSVSGPELRAFARIYHRPLSYFFEEESQESPAFQYLFRAAEHDILDRASIVEFEKLTRDYALLEELVGASPLPLPPDYSQFAFRTESDAEALADMERSRLSLGDAPVKEITDLMDFLDSTAGIRTFLVPVQSSTWSGLVVRDPGGRPCIAVNAKDESYRRNFLLAHEYGHALVHMGGPDAVVARIDREAEPERMPAEERFANAFASAFLMPRRAVLAQLERMLGASNGQFTDFDLVHLAMRFGISGQAMSSRLISLRKMPRHVHEDYWKSRSFKSLAQALGYEVEDWGREVVLPPRYRYLALKAYDEGQISLAKLAELLRENYYELRKRLSATDDEPAETRRLGRASG